MNSTVILFGVNLDEKVWRANPCTFSMPMVTSQKVGASRLGIVIEVYAYVDTIGN